MSIKIELFDPAIPSTDPTSTPVTFAVEEYTREIVEVYAPAAVAVGGGSEGVAEHLTDPNPHPQYWQSPEGFVVNPDDTSVSYRVGGVFNRFSISPKGLMMKDNTGVAQREVALGVEGFDTFAVGGGIQASVAATIAGIGGSMSNASTSTSQGWGLNPEGLYSSKVSGGAPVIDGQLLWPADGTSSRLFAPTTGSSEETLATREWADGQYVPTTHTDETGAKHAAANISFAAGGTLSAGTVQSGIIALDARVTSLQKPTTYTTALTSERERLDLNFALVTTSSDLKVIYSNSKKVSWDNEWGALRGTSPYSWGDALVRGIRENSDGITNGQFLQLEDRRTGAASNVMFGVNWTDGSIVRNGNRMADVWYRANSSVAIPANLPVGTIVITGSA